MIHQRRSRIELHSVAGVLAFEAAYGQDPQTRDWLCPTRVRLGLEAREAMTPELQERLCFTATQTLSYEAAAQVAAKWGSGVSCSAVYQHVQRRGETTRRERAAEVERALDVNTRAEVVAAARAAAPSGEFSLVLMLDGWMIRERGEQWGLEPPEAAGERVDWREVKSGIVFRLEDRAESSGGRRMVLEKHIEAYRGDPYEFGRRFYALALRQGLMQAQRVYVVADGAVWIWHVVEDRFSHAIPLLDFHHASQHLWAVAHAVSPQDDDARAWVVPLLHQLRHGGEAGVLHGLQGLLELFLDLNEEQRHTVEGAQNYFETHRDRLGYQRAADLGCPVGSGAMESTCSQLQDRFKRTGQFWIFQGHSNLMALDLARRNNEWNDIWANHYS